MREYFTGPKRREEYELEEILLSAPLYKEEVPFSSIVGVMFSVGSYQTDVGLSASFNVYGVILLATPK